MPPRQCTCDFMLDPDTVYMDIEHECNSIVVLLRQFRLGAFLLNTRIKGNLKKKQRSNIYNATAKVYLLPHACKDRTPGAQK